MLTLKSTIIKQSTNQPINQHENANVKNDTAIKNYFRLRFLQLALTSVSVSMLDVSSARLVLTRAPIKSPDSNTHLNKCVS